MDAARGALVDAVSVVVIGVGLALRHLPTLLLIYLVGAGVRNGVMWAAVELSDSHRTLAGLLLPLAPMATLTAIVLMLRVVASELHWATFDPGSGARYLGLLASTLIPFLTVYAAQGYLKDDLKEFINAAAYDEIFGQAGSFYGESADIDRTIIASGWLLAALVLTALLVRFLLTRFDLPSKHVSFAIGAAYVEVLWMFALASQLTRYQGTIWAWVEQRKAVDWVQDRWTALLEVVGPFAAPLQALARGLGNLLSDADAVVVVPIAWLTVGAVALGQRVDAPTVPRPGGRRGPGRYVARVPAVVRRAGVEATADLRSRFTRLGQGLRLLAIGGLLPMLMFCIVFVVARQAGNLTAELLRSLIGPLERDTGLAVSPYVELATDGVYTVALVGLLAAAIDRIVRRQQRDESAQPIGSSA